MYKRKIKYTDYNGKEREEDFYFNLNQSEIVEMEAEADGGLADRLRSIVESNNGKVIMRVFKDFILRSYGEKSEDGKSFYKSEEIRRKFECSEAYNVLFIEMCTDANAASIFIENVLPLTAEQKREFNIKSSEIKANN